MIEDITLTLTLTLTLALTLTHGLAFTLRKDQAKARSQASNKKLTYPAEKPMPTTNLTQNQASSTRHRSKRRHRSCQGSSACSPAGSRQGSVNKLKNEDADELQHFTPKPVEWVCKDISPQRSCRGSKNKLKHEDADELHHFTLKSVEWVCKDTSPKPVEWVCNEFSPNRSRQGSRAGSPAGSRQASVSKLKNEDAYELQYSTPKPVGWVCKDLSPNSVRLRNLKHKERLAGLSLLASFDASEIASLSDLVSDAMGANMIAAYSFEHTTHQLKDSDSSASTNPSPAHSSVELLSGSSATVESSLNKKSKKKGKNSKSSHRKKTPMRKKRQISKQIRSKTSLTHELSTRDRADSTSSLSSVGSHVALYRKAQEASQFLDDDDPPVLASASSSSSFSAIPAQSLDDENDDPSVLASASSSSSSSSSPSWVSHDPRAVKLCKSLLSLPEQLKQLEGGRYTDKKEGSDVFEVNMDRLRGSVEVLRFRNIPRGLEAATREAREHVADQVAKLKKDVAGLEQESAFLTKKMQESKGEGTDALAIQYAGLQVMIGKRKEEVRALEHKNAVEVNVEVERVSTRVKIVTEETVR